FCIPQRSGPKPTAHSDVVDKHRREVELLCQAVDLSLTVKPWKIHGEVSVDTRTLLRLVGELRAAMSRGDLEESVSIIGQLRACAPQLKEYELPEKWPLGNLMTTVSQQVPPDHPRDATLAEEFKRHAMEVTGL